MKHIFTILILLWTSALTGQRPNELIPAVMGSLPDSSWHNIKLVRIGTDPLIDIVNREMYTGSRKVINISSPSPSSTTTDFGLYSILNPNADATITNHVMVLGSNYDGAKSNISRMWDAWESNWNNNVMERHYEIRLPNGEGSRLFSSTFISGGTLATSSNQWDFRASLFSVAGLTSESYFAITSNAATSAFNMTIKAENNSAGLSLMGNGTNNIVYMDAVNPNAQLQLRNWGNIFFSPQFIWDNGLKKLTIDGTVQLNSLPVYLNDDAAGAAGLPTNTLYATPAGDVKIKLYRPIL